MDEFLRAFWIDRTKTHFRIHVDFDKFAAKTLVANCVTKTSGQPAKVGRLELEDVSVFPSPSSRTNVSTPRGAISRSGLSETFLQLFDIGRDMDALDRHKLRHAMRPQPGEEFMRGAGRGAARMRIPDLRREEFKEAIGGGIASGRDEGGGAIGNGRDELIRTGTISASSAMFTKQTP